MRTVFKHKDGRTIIVKPAKYGAYENILMVFNGEERIRMTKFRASQRTVLDRMLESYRKEGFWQYGERKT